MRFRMARSSSDIVPPPKEPNRHDAAVAQLVLRPDLGCRCFWPWTALQGAGVRWQDCDMARLRIEWDDCDDLARTRLRPCEAGEGTDPPLRGAVRYEPSEPPL